MAELASRQVHEVLDALASRAEPPAAGAASAIATATAAALVELTAGLAAERRAADGSSADEETVLRLRAIADRTSELRERLMTIADDDARAYARVTKAEGGADHAKALERASEPPLAIAECAADVAELAEETARAGTWAFRADAVVAGELAAAAAAAGAEMVATNLARDPDDPRLSRARAAADRAQRARDSATDAPPH